MGCYSSGGSGGSSSKLCISDGSCITRQQNAVGNCLPATHLPHNLADVARGCRHALRCPPLPLLPNLGQLHRQRAACGMGAAGQSNEQESQRKAQPAGGQRSGIVGRLQRGRELAAPH